MNRAAALAALVTMTICTPARAQQTDRIISGYGFTVDGDNLVVAGQRFGWLASMLLNCSKRAKIGSNANIRPVCSPATF